MDALKQLKLAKNGYIIMSVLFMVLGACLIIWPDCSMAVFCTAVGIMLIVYGLIKILGYFSRDIYCLAFQFDLDEGEIRILIQYYKCLFMGFLMEWLDNNLKSDFGEEMRQASRLFEKHPELHAVLNRSE